MTKFSNIVKASVFSSIAIVSLAVAGPALAASSDSEQAPQIEMPTNGADFASPAVVKQLQNQARRVARDMCFIGSETLPSLAERECYNTAIKSAFTQIEAKHQLALTGTTTDVAVGETIHSSVRTDH